MGNYGNLDKSQSHGHQSSSSKSPSSSSSLSTTLRRPPNRQRHSVQRGDFLTSSRRRFLGLGLCRLALRARCRSRCRRLLCLFHLLIFRLFLSLVRCPAAPSRLPRRRRAAPLRCSLFRRLCLLRHIRLERLVLEALGLVVLQDLARQLRYTRWRFAHRLELIQLRFWLVGTLVRPCLLLGFDM